MKLGKLRSCGTASGEPRDDAATFRLAHDHPRSRRSELSRAHPARRPQLARLRDGQAVGAATGLAEREPRRAANARGAGAPAQGTPHVRRGPSASGLCGRVTGSWLGPQTQDLTSEKQHVSPRRARPEDPGHRHYQAPVAKSPRPGARLGSGEPDLQCAPRKTQALDPQPHPSLSPTFRVIAQKLTYRSLSPICLRLNGNLIVICR